jgi:hypothetical protein
VTAKRLYAFDARAALEGAGLDPDRIAREADADRDR